MFIFLFINQSGVVLALSDNLSFSANMAMALGRGYIYIYIFFFFFYLSVFLAGNSCFSFLLLY